MLGKIICLIRAKTKYPRLFVVTILVVSSSITAKSSYASTSEFVACKFWNPATESFSVQGNFEIRDNVVIGTSVGTLCKGLIDIPEGVIEIQHSVFLGASEIKEVSLPSTMRTIGHYAFRYSTLETVTAKNGLQDIGISAFHGSQLKTFSSINSVRNIYASAFYNTGLRSFNFSNSIERIEDSAFQETQLQFVKLPSSLSHIGTSVFADIRTLTGFEFPSGITEIPEGILALSSSLGTPIPSELISTIYIPDSVIKIGDYAFKNRNSISNIDLSFNLKQIGIQSLSGTSINNLTFPRNLETISAEALMNTPLTRVRFNEGIKSIGQSAFRDTLITKAFFPNSLEYLNRAAFYNSPLREVTIGKNANFNDSYAFSNLDLTGITAESVSIKYCPEMETDSSTMVSILENSILGYYILNDSRDFSCSVPDQPTLLAAVANGSNGIRIKVASPFSDGGEPIAKLIFTDENSKLLGEVDYSGTDIYSLSGFSPGQSLRVKVAAINSVGISAYSTLSSPVTTDIRLSEEEQRAQQREAERIRQQRIDKARSQSLKKLEANQALNLEDFGNSDFNEVNSTNINRIQDKLEKLMAQEGPTIEAIRKAVDYIVLVDRIATYEKGQAPLYGQKLMALGLISSQNKSVTQICYLVKNSLPEERRDEESLLNLITRLEAEIKARNDRLAALRARTEARTKAA